MKIAITFRDDQEMGNLWYGSGIAQNIKFYYDLFEQMGFEPMMLVNNIIGLEAFGKHYRELRRIEAIDNKVSLDLIIEAGTVISIEDKALFREKCGAKIIGLRCGNQYTFAAEGLFVKQEFPVNLFVGGHDSMWILPHHGKQSQWLSVVHRCPCEVVPYIWEADFVEKQLHDIERPKKPKIFVMEANMSPIKNALVPMTILDKLFEQAPESFDTASILNADNFFDKDYFLYNFVNNLPVLQAENNKVVFGSRFPIFTTFDAPNILLGHQVDNDLNNLYKEALYMGIPLVHNSPSYKNMGYYYPDLDVDRGVEQLKKAIHTHDAVAYKENNHSRLKAYSIYNKSVQKHYHKLIKKVIS